MEHEIIYQMSSLDNLRTIETANVRWLEYHEDYNLFCRHLQACGQKPVTEEQWSSFRDEGTTYCGLILEGEMVARAAVERYSDTAWESADVRVVRSERSKGHAKQVVCFVTKYILLNGRMATCRTLESNLAMKKVIQSTGFTLKQ